MANVWKSVCVLRAQSHVLKRKYSTTPPGLLGDVNVLDMSRIVAGPFCTMTLGDLGANVIKVESLDGDESRKWGPPFIKENSDSVYFLSMNRNKKSICVDFKTQEGKNVLYDLAKKCDVMVENFVSGTLDKHAVGYEQLGQLNPRLVYCAITGFGPHGPYAKKPGYDVIAAAMGGFLHSTGEPNGAPVKAGVAITDITTGLHAFGAIVSALYHRERTGLGQKIDCNLFSTQISSMMNLATMYLNCGIEAQKYGTAHANLVPYEAFESKDGYMVVGAGSNAQYASLCKKFNRADLITDERFLDNAKRVENRVELVKIITEIMKTKTNKEWSKLFEGAAFANGPVNKLKDVFEDEHVNAVGLVRELDHPDAGKIKLVGPPTEYSVPRGNSVRMPPPRLGQHTREVLQSFLGYSNKKVDALYQDKVIR